MLDINLLRAEKGGNPDLVRESQRKRGGNVQVVDEIIALDEEWRKGLFNRSISQAVNFGLSSSL